MADRFTDITTSLRLTYTNRGGVIDRLQEATAALRIAQGTIGHISAAAYCNEDAQSILQEFTDARANLAEALLRFTMPPISPEGYPTD